MSLMEEEDAGKTSNLGKKAKEDIMKAIISFTCGLYKKISIVQLKITDVKRQVLFKFF